MSKFLGFARFAASALAFVVVSWVCPSRASASWAMRLDFDPARPSWW